MLRLMGRALVALMLCGLVAIAIGGAITAMTHAPPERGRQVDIGGRTMRIVCAGPPAGDQPTVILESGAFGFSADWAAVQAKLAAKGIRSCAYDRAGLGFSDPGLAPRDGAAVAADLGALLTAAGEEGPYVLAGHSMGGMYVRLFHGSHPNEVVGVVLIEASTGEMAESARMARFVSMFGRIARVSVLAARLGVMNLLAPLADTIGLPPEAAAEKRWVFGKVEQNRWAADEALAWPVTAQQAAASPAFPVNLPVAVVLAGTPGDSEWARGRSAPARLSGSGFVGQAAGASHASILGRDHADAVVDAILHVLRNLAS